MTDSILSLPLELQVALGGGYLAHAIAYGGLRKATGATELALRSLAFGLGALLCYRMALRWDWPVTVAVMSAVVGAVILGALWRRWGMKWTRAALSAFGISREDGIPDAWAALIQTPGLCVTQLSVHTADGRTLHHERAAYPEALLDGLYFGSDGSLIMVVNEEEMPDGSTEKRDGLYAPEWGTRLTYIPGDQITRINLRTPTIS